MACHQLLILASLLHGYYSQSGWPCSIEHCSWNHRLGNGQGTDPTVVSTDVFCRAKATTDQQPIPIYRSLPSNLTSLSISCVDQKSACYIKGKHLAKYRNMKTLTVEKCNMNFIDLNFTFDLEHLSTLHFDGVILPSFQPKSFSKYQHLTSLTISRSNMKNFPFMADFNDNLQILNISRNHIQFPEIIVPENYNLTLGNLSTLDLSYNNLRAIPQQLYSTGLNIKHLQWNQISNPYNLPSNARLNELETFDASGNPIQVFNLNTLHSSNNLTYFRISGTNESYLSLDDVIFFPNLRDLMISNFDLNDSIWSLLHIPSVTRLNLSFNALERVVLHDISMLERLYVQHNDISVLSEDTFTNLPYLKVLNLSCNHLQHLPESLFRANPQLIAILLSKNKITSLPSGIFNLNQGMFYLDLSYNRLKRLPYSIFRKLSHLLFLYLQGNHLQFLPLFSTLNKLHHLDISHNLLKHITANNFKGLVSLQILVASDNRFKIIPHGLITPCNLLLSADFSNNPLEMLGTFENHPKLLELKLMNTSLRGFNFISPFRGMRSLQYIFLDDNNFITVTPRLFPPTIKSISLSNNDVFIILRRSLMDMPHLVDLNLMSNRGVIEMPQASVHIYTPGSLRPTLNLAFTTLRCNCYLGYLKVWYENRHQIKILRERFPKFVGLEHVMCTSPFFPGYRPFKDVPLSQFVCEYNETICLDNSCTCCRLPDWNDCHCSWTCPSECQCFAGGSSFWKDYIHINCQSRNLTYIPDLIPSSGTNVYLDGNNITSVTRDLLGHLSDVIELNLNDSQIESIEDGVFDGMGALEYLRLQINRITTIHRETFGNVTSLIELDLSYNRISSIEPGSFEGLTNLKTLNLHHNSLTTIPDVLDLPAVMSVTLAENPWSCKCHLIKTLLTYFSAVEQFIVDKDSVCCSFESESYKQRRLEFSNSSFQIPDTEEPMTRFDSDDVITGNGSGGNSLALSYDDDPNEGSFQDDTYNNLTSRPDVEKSAIHLTSALSTSPATNRSCFPMTRFILNLTCRIERPAIGIMASGTFSSDNPVIFIVLIIVACSFMVMLFLVAMITWRRRELQALLYNKTGVRIWDKKADLDKPDGQAKVFDAFISYSHGDHEFVCNTLVPNLEKKKFHVCVHYRDFPVGGDIADVIKRAIHLSSRTVMVVSKHFIRSNWCRFEFQTSHRYILKEGSRRLVLLLLEEISDDELDPDFKAHMKSNTYLKASDKWFWEKLYFALPSISGWKDAAEDGRDSVMRGMRILAGEDLEQEREMGGGENEKDREGDNEGGETIPKKIDWKKEEEKILNERKIKEKILNEYDDSNSDYGVIVEWKVDNNLYNDIDEGLKKQTNNRTGIVQEEKNNVNIIKSLTGFSNIYDGDIDKMGEGTENSMKYADIEMYDVYTGTGVEKLEKEDDEEIKNFQWVTNEDDDDDGDNDDDEIARNEVQEHEDVNDERNASSMVLKLEVINDIDRTSEDDTTTV